MKTKPLKCYNGGKDLLVVPPTVPEVIANTSQGVKTSATILKGDCLVHMKSLPDKSVDLIICDLPYGCLSIEGKSKISKEKAKEIWGNWAEKKLQSYGNGCSWDIKIDLEVFWKEVKRIRKSDHTPCIHFCTTKFGYELIRSNEKEFRHDLVWDKQRGVSFLSANKMPMRSHEMVYIFSKAGANYNRIDISGDFKNTNKGGRPSKPNVYLNTFKDTPKESNEGKRCALSVINIMNCVGKGKHPTEKPIDLYKWLIERYSKEGETVLDPTAGSFNSGVASVELNRKYIGIEKDTAFFNKAISKFV